MLFVVSRKSRGLKIIYPARSQQRALRASVGFKCRKWKVRQATFQRLGFHMTFTCTLSNYFFLNIINTGIVMPLPLFRAAPVATRCCAVATPWQPHSFIRHVSRTSAINRGIRASQKTTSDQSDRRAPRATQRPTWNQSDRRAPRNFEAPKAPTGWEDPFAALSHKSHELPINSHKKKEKRPLNAAERSKRYRANARANNGVGDPSILLERKGPNRKAGRFAKQQEYEAKQLSIIEEHVSRDENAKFMRFSADTTHRPKDDVEKPQRTQRDDVPLAIPYTTASSQFLYGANAVSAALRGNRRKVYKLFLKKEGESLPERREDRHVTHPLRNLAQRYGVEISWQRDTRLLDKLSEGRPHNGVALEVSALPTPPATVLRKPHAAKNTVTVDLDQQNAEDKAVNGDALTLKYDSKSWRQPFVLFLDGITDPGNLGGILRTAHFYGVDAVAVAVNTCANLTSTVLAKASSGACEAIPILAVSRPSDFIARSGKEGWRICAAVAPENQANRLHKQLTPAGISLTNPLARNPCILMLGSEGFGLRANLRTKADLDVTILSGVSGSSSVGVDSLNVGVAGAVLLDAFMREPPRTRASNSERMF